MLLENYAAVIDEIVRAKPSFGEGPLHPLQITLTSTMGPGIRVDATKTSERDLAPTAAREAAGEPANA